MAKMKYWNGTTWEILDAKDADTVDGKHAAATLTTTEKNDLAGAINEVKTELDKKASNKNLLVNWDFRNPVNQRGQSSYSGAGYTVDGWQLVSSGSNLSVSAGGVTLSGTGTGILRQVIESPSAYHGKTVTISAIIGGIVYQATGVIPSAVPSALTTVAIYNLDDNRYVGLLYTDTGEMYFQFRTGGGTSLNNISAAKLELGSVSTLANDPPAVYSEQLAFCGSIVLTATLNTTWSGTSAPYTKTVAVNGIQSSDTPIIDVVMSGTYSTDEARIEAWGYIYRAVTADNAITFYATDKPTVSLPLQIKVVR